MTKINLLILRTHNLEKLRIFYEGIFNVVFEEHLDHGPRHYGAKFDESYIEIYPTSKEQGQLDGFGMNVENIETLLRRVSKEDLHRSLESSPKGRSAIIRDPDNRLIYLSDSQVS